MKKAYPSSQIQNLITSSQKILVLLSKNPSFDQVASGLSLYLSLEKAGKQVFVASPDKMVVGFSHLVGLDKVKTELTGNDLVVTLVTPIENIEKVFTTNEETGSLQIVIRAKPGRPPVKKGDLSFSSQGALPDLIFTIGVRKPEGLGRLYQEKKEMFSQKPVINIDNHPQNTAFGRLNLVDSRAACLSEIIVALLSELGLPVDQDIGSNLVLGLRRATDNFQSQKVSADTFEAATLAMRFQGGAKKLSPPEGRPASPDASQAPSEPPAEWLEPKIYKGSTLP